MRSLFSDHAGIALQNSWKGTLPCTIPGQASPDADIIDFLKKRFEHLPDADDAIATRRWSGMLILMDKQRSMIDLLLKATGQGMNEAAQSTNKVQFVDRPLKMQDRKVQLPSLVDLAVYSAPILAKNLGLPAPPIGSRESLENQIKRFGSQVKVLIEANNPPFGLLTVKEIPWDKPDPEWTDSYPVGGQTISVPSRAMLQMPSVIIERLAFHKDLPLTMPTRAIEYILRHFPSHMIEWRVTAWDK